MTRACLDADEKNILEENKSKMKGGLIGNIHFLRRLTSTAWGRWLIFLEEETLLPLCQKERTKDGHRGRLVFRCRW